MIDILFLPPLPDCVNFAQLIYDLAIAFLTGYIVWYKTDECMQRRDEVAQYRYEQQEYSRYLGRIKNLANALAEGKVSGYEVKNAIEDGPIRELFIAQQENEREVFNDIGNCLQEIKDLVSADNLDKNELGRATGGIIRNRIEILRFRLIQPHMNPVKIWGQPATARARRKL